MELVITQLTDIHIKEEKDFDILLERTDSIVGAISETIRNKNETMLLICITGDIANDGLEEQYILAELLLEEIYKKIKNRYESLYTNFIFVPGNHDCDFKDPKNVVRQAVLNSNQLDYEDNTTIETCTQIQKNYYMFVDKFVKKEIALANSNKCIFTEHTIINNQLGDYNIKLHCLNTAWCSKIEETKNMLFSVPEKIEKKLNNDIVITLMHHGSEWFNWEGAEKWKVYYKEFSDIILIGHDHSTDFVHKSNYDNSSNYFIMGNQLYSTNRPEQSGFNVLKIDFQNNIQIFYTYSWDGNLYTKIINSGSQKFEKNRYSRVNLEINSEFKEYLEDIDIDISSKYKTNLLLSDIYVFPILEGEQIDNPNKSKIYRDYESILDFIQKKKKIIINGNKEYGKTSFLKKMFIVFFEIGQYPIFLNPNEIKSADENILNNYIREQYNKSYNNINIDEIMQKSEKERVCIIDNFNEINLSDKSFKLFIEYIIGKFDIILLTTNNKVDLMESMTNLETNDFIKEEFCELIIKPLRSYGRSKLIDKWLLLEDFEQDTTSKSFDGKRKEKMSQMDSIFKSGYFSSTPLEFLLVLSYLDNSEMMNADYSRYSYIYDCLIREKINEISKKDTKEALAYKTLLEILAYNIYISKNGFLFKEEFLLKAIFDYNENYPSFKTKSTKIIELLKKYKIIIEKNDGYKFKYNYMYYYFVGSYIVDISSAAEKSKKLEEILSDLTNETNYNIALFMAYSLNPEHEILPKINDLCKGLLNNYANFKYEDQKELLEKVNCNVLKKINKIYNIPTNSEIPKLQKEKLIANDDLDEQKENKKNTETKENTETEKSKDEIKAFFNDFTKLLRLIEFQGDMLKNYATKIKNKPRMETIELMAESNLKLIGFLYNWISSETDKIIKIVEKKALENNEDKIPGRDKLLALIKEFISMLWSEIIEVNVNNLSSCWECDLIEDDIINFRENRQSVFFDMVSIEYKIMITDDKLPISDIERCLSGKRKFDSFSISIIKDIIASYLSTYQYDSKDKERVCQLLGYKYKKLFIEDQKMKTLGL